MSRDPLEMGVQSGAEHCDSAAERTRNALTDGKRASTGRDLRRSYSAAWLGGRYAPRYRHPEVQVSCTTTSLSSGSAGFSRSQIHTASRSLVGFSSPSMSFR